MTEVDIHSISWHFAGANMEYLNEGARSQERLNFLSKHSIDHLDYSADTIESADLIHINMINNAKNIGRQNLALMNMEDSHDELMYKHFWTLNSFSMNQVSLMKEIEMEIKQDELIQNKILNARSVSQI